MIKLSRAAITVFTLAFGVYHAALALLNFDHFTVPQFAVAAIALYLAALGLSLSDRPGLRLKDSKAAFSLVAAMLISLFMAGSISAVHGDGHATWHVAGIATLMAIIALRQHKVLAWFGLTIMPLEVFIWRGIDQLFNAGIFGAVMIVSAAHAASVTLSSTSKAASEFREQASATAAATAAKSAARAERQSRVDKALDAALPLLNKIASLGGALTESQKREAIELEAMLRDQIRGRNFDLPELLAEVANARARGVEIQLLDDGGLEQLPEPQRQALLKEVAAHVAKVESGKLVLRSVAGEKWIVSIAASQVGAEVPDLFVRL